MKKQSSIDAILARVKGNKRARRIASVLACLVVFVTLWRLTLPAITLEWGKPQAEGITEPETLQEEELLTEETLAEEPDEEEPLLRWATLKEAEEAGYPDAVRVDRLICGQTESEGHRHSADCIESYYALQSASFAEEAFLAMPAQHFEGEAVSLTVRVDAEEGTFPEDTEMALAEADPEAVRRAATHLMHRKIDKVLAVDIGFLYEGEKIEPEQAVQVMLSGSALEGLENLAILHIDGEGNAEIISHRTAEEAATASRMMRAAPMALTGAVEAEPKNAEEHIDNTDINTETAQEDAEDAASEDEAADAIPEGALVFEAKDFSVYAVVSYTADFYWEVDGKTFEFSLPGGGFVSLEHLVELLGIGRESEAAADAEDEEAGGNAVYTPADLNALEISEETREFVRHIGSAEFSSPELVSVSKAEEDTTVGAIKEALSLACEYSAELTEEQIAEINQAAVEAGDWALISLKPFLTEESLTVTLENGEVFTIRVTDAQIKKTFLSDSGEMWEIIVEYEEDAKIPPTAELRVKEITPEDEAYPEYCRAAVDKTGAAPEEHAPTEEAQPVADAETADADAEKAEPAGSAVEHSLTAEAAYARFFDIEIWDGEQQIEPAAPVTVSIRLLDAPQESDAVPAVVHFAEAGLDVMDASLTTGTAPEGTAETEFKFRTETFSVYGVVYTIVIETRVITASGETFIISVSFNQDAGIPENATLEAKEILEGTEEYARYLEKSRMALIQRGTEKAAPTDTTEPADETEPSAETPSATEANPEVEEAQTADTDAPEDKEGVTLRALADTAQDIVSARFFDLTILADGEKVEPRAPVSVKIRYAEPVELDGTESVQVVHFGDKAEVIDPAVSGGSATQADTFDFKTTSFSVYGVLAQFITDADHGEFTVAGEDFSIRIVYGPEAQIPAGTVLTVRELDPAGDEYIQRLGQAWYEVNREYFEVEEMREHYDEGMGDLPDLHLVNLDAARFFDISFEYGGRKLEPGDAVRVEISYSEGLKALGECVPVSGVAHFGAEAVELLDNVQTVTDANGGFVSFKYAQRSFSDTGTFVGQETYDEKTPQYMAPAPVYDPAKAVTLASLGAEGPLGAGEGGGSSLPSPASSKKLTPNNDGTYTLNLSVAGSSKSTSTAEVNRSNVLIVMDRSSSMINNKVKIYTAYNGRPKGNTTYYGKDGDTYFQLFTNNNRYYRTRTQYGFGYTYSNEYTGQVYTATEGNRRLDEEQEALSELITQLLAKNNEFKQDSQGYLLDDNNERVLDENDQPIRVNDIIEISVISFADQRLDHTFTYPDNIGGRHTKEDTEVGWTTDYNTLIDSSTTNPKGVMSDFAPSGTNWEDALQYAKDVADAKHAAQPDEPMFVLFLTDGEPTAVAGETYKNGSGAHHYTNSNGIVGGGFIEAYEPARDDAKALVDAGYEFYGIFTYGEGAEQVGYLKRLVNVAYGHADDTTQTDDLTEHFHDAGDNAALLSAFQHILSKISDTISVGNVTVADGLTTDATATTLVNGQADGFRYTVSGPMGTLYSVTATGSDANPTVTFTINGQPVTGTKKTEHVTRNQVDGDGNPIPDSANPGKYLTVTEDKTYYSATVGSTEYKMALASIAQGGQITWDLSAVGTLMEGYTYNCSFVVWPNQEAYDYVAGLNNGLTGYEWNQDNATAVRDGDGNVIYYEGGVSQYPSIVKYPNGTFSVLTNTNQSVTYSIVDTKTDETTGETETTYDGPYTKPLEYPKPMDLTGSSLSITKNWDDSMDAQQLKDVVEDYAEQNPGKTYSVTLTMYENGVKYKDFVFTPVWDAAQNRYTWESADFNIAPALLVSKHPGGGKTYKTVTIDGKTYYVLNDGHEYTLDEEVVDYHFEFSADPYHPALVDGVLYNVKFDVDGSGNIVSGSTATIQGDTLDTFTGTNTLKGRLYVTKETVVPAGTTGVDLEAITFDVKVTLTDRVGHEISSPTNGSGNYDAESGLMYRIHYGPNNPKAGEYSAEYGNYGRSDKKPVKDGVITETIYAGDQIYVGNMPVGTHYEVEETAMPLGWKQVGIVAKNQDDSVDSLQIIYGNKADYVTITNTVPSFDVNIKKTTENGSTPLGGAHFKLYGADYYVTDEGGHKTVNETPTLIADNLVSDATTGLISLGQLGGGEYYLVETSAPAGYVPLSAPIRIVVNGASDQTKTYADEPTSRPLYVTYEQTGNSLSGNNEDVAIGATALTDGTGEAMTDEDGHTVYSYTYTLTVTNNPGAELPSTGGPGTRATTLAGLALTLLALAGIAEKRKHR